MSTEQNKALVRRFTEEVFNRGNISLVAELVASDFVEHAEYPPGRESERGGTTTLFRSAFPDFKVTIDDLIAEGDKVVVRSTWSGTHKGEFMGNAPTGKSVSFGVIDIIRFAGGKAVEHWGQMDRMGMMQQLGVIPVPGEGGE
jgi:predicted ester cyclase